MKLKEVLDRTVSFFKEKKLDSPRLDAELLLAHGLGIERIQLYLRFDQPLKDEELQNCRELVRRRSQGEPVAYIVGYKDFYGLRFQVGPDVLIPRPETEHIVETVLDRCKIEEAEYRFLDLGTGSGCIGLSLLRNLPNARLVAVDASPGALEIAHKNAVDLGVSDRVEFLCGDAQELSAKISGGFDAICANPPYIDPQDSHVEKDVKKYEPESALFAKDQGLYFLKTWSEVYLPHLKPGGWILMEMGFEQGEAMVLHFENLGAFSEVRVIKDLAGHDRIIYGEKNG